MIIRQATDYEAVRAFYHSLIDAMQETPCHPKWQKDVYPAPEDLKTAIQEQAMFIGVVEDRIAAAMAVNHSCGEGYRDAAWTQALSPDEFLVIHMLGVHRDFTGQGYAKALVRFAIHLAEETGMKAIRLDVLEGNLPAERLYEGLGFRYVETVQLFYEDTGRMNFKLYEYRVS